MSPDFQNAFAKLKENTPEECDETVRILCKIADNILQNPLNSKIRILQKSNATVSKKIISVSGGVDCLKLMGFEDRDNHFIMKTHVPLTNVEDFKKALLSWRELIKQKSESKVPSASSANASSTSEQIIKKINLPPLQYTYTNSFLRKLEYYAHAVLQYEDKNLQERVRNIIPINRLEENAQKRLRRVQEVVKKNKLEDPDLSIQDMLINELLFWFKNEFFSWVDSPPCDYCGEPTAMSHNSTDSDLLKYADRVELHKCKTCQKLTPFARYNDLNILLETRRGRCGEWANTFTLCCRALGWDARFVVDEGDHVWTEVFSVGQKRWLHCDSCENVCDSPLMYETGWGKKLSYVMAYSAEDIQDVTWRYSSKHKEILQRRKQCTEEELLTAIFKIRSNQQKNLTAARKGYLLKRTLMELAEFFGEKQVTTNDVKQRTSGSEAWRLARGEVTEMNLETKYVWTIKSEDIIDNSVTIRYSCALNKYQYISGNKTILELTDWTNGVYEHYSVFRKVEQDWKMVYLARRDGHRAGLARWRFEFQCPDRKLETVAVQCGYQTFENGRVNVEISQQDGSVSFSEGEQFLSSDKFKGAKELSITATLSEGKGDEAWQHAQLFRQSVDSCDYTFCVTFTFQGAS